jgi:hypothetical protein
MSFGRLGSLGRGFGRIGSSGGGGSVIVPGVIAAGGGSYVWTGQDATLTVTTLKSVAADSGSYLWTGDDATPVQNHIIGAAGSSYAWTGQDATLTKSASYTGPGDVVSGAISWYGLRAYNAAYATGSNPAIRLVDQAGGNQQIFNILSDGTLDVASIQTWVTANSVSTIKVNRIYDQVGSVHLEQATLANMPVLVLSGNPDLASNRPAIQFTGSSSQVLTTGSYPSTNQPISYATVAQRVGTANGGILSGNGGEPELSFGPGAANQVFVFANNTPATQAATDSAFHGIQGVFNGASSVANVDGTSGSTANAGSTGIVASQFRMGIRFSDYLTGYVCEGGVWTVAFSGGDMTSLNTNQQAYWGY